MLKTPYEGINKWSKLLPSEKHTNLIYRLAMSYCKTSHTKQGIHQNLEFKKNFKLKQFSRTQTFHVSKFYLLLFQIRPLDLYSYQLKRSCFEGLTNAWEQNKREGIESRVGFFLPLFRGRQHAKIKVKTSLGQKGQEERRDITNELKRNGVRPCLVNFRIGVETCQGISMIFHYKIHTQDLSLFLYLLSQFKLFVVLWKEGINIKSKMLNMVNKEKSFYNFKVNWNKVLRLRCFP